MSDIVDRLRAMAGPIVPNVCTEAADEIERLRKALQDISQHPDEPYSADYARDALASRQQ